MMNYCDNIEIQKNLFFIVGRHLNVAKSEADVANSIIYKKSDALYIIDTGVTLEFRELLLNQCKSLKPYNKIILINSHGHADHTANNVILESLEAEQKYHYISTHDLEMMKDNLTFFTYSFDKITPLTNLFTNAHDKVSNLLKLFQPIEFNTSYVQTLEALPTCDLDINNIHWSGWNIDDAIYICRSQGHSAGHVVIYFPEEQHMHLADETTGYCNLFHDCDHLKSVETQTKTLSMLKNNSIKTLTDGHTFKVHDKKDGIAFLSNLIEAHYIYDNALQEILNKHPNGLKFIEIQEQLSKNQKLLTLPKGANPNPLYAQLMLLSKFRDFGIVPDREDIANALFNFRS
ncbi:MAG: MBL fold metallo-hydrolase [Alphaproteobacteria bacterium]|nr:MBL fold metallo-hydrolase [Candidatus Jidaibacter sp.]